MIINNRVAFVQRDDVAALQARQNCFLPSSYSSDQYCFTRSAALKLAACDFGVSAFLYACLINLSVQTILLGLTSKLRYKLLRCVCPSAFWRVLLCFIVHLVLLFFFFYLHCLSVCLFVCRLCLWTMLPDLN